MKRVWLNMNTGEFSNSWNAEEFADSVEKHMNDESINPGNMWKLIEYKVLNDESFELYNMMQIITNNKHCKDKI